MADQKVSDLPALNGADVDAADLLYIVDSSAGTAGSKRITIGQFQVAPFSGGTANAVMYFNGSKVVASDSALTFDGTNFATTGTASAAKLIPTGGTATGNGLYLPSANTLALSTDGTERARITSAGDLQFQATGSAVSNVASINGGQIAGMRNKIINGAMDIAQRGTSFPAIASGGYSLDRWVWNAITSGVVTISQQADVPSSNEFQNSLRVAVTTADTSIAAGDVANVLQLIEGYNARDLIGKTFTLSFWVRSSKTGIHCVNFRNSGLDRTFVSEYTVNAANTWEQKSVTVTGGLITAGTWDWITGIGLRVGWALAAGSTFQTTAGAWQTGNFLATSNQVNCLDSNTNIFAITGVQLEVGSVATPFEHRPYGTELALCQRYFYAYTSGASGFGEFGIGYLRGTTSFVISVKYPVPMRVAPTTFAANGVAADYAYQAGGTTCAANALPTGVAFGPDSASIEFTSATASTIGFGGRAYASGGARVLSFSAEL